MKYQIKRKAGNADVIVATISPIGTQSRQAMGADIVDMTFSLADYVDIRIGDFVDVYGLRYFINLPVKEDKLSSRNYSYTVQFEAQWYDLAKVQYQFLNPKNQLLEPVFDLTGTADDFIDLLVQNANRHSAGWTIGVVDVTDYKTLPFSTQNCLQVLHTLASEFDTEFWIDNKTIHLQKREQSSGYTFEYGKGNGLYNISRQNKSNINIFTRLYVRGGSTNLSADYPANALLLPNGVTYIQDTAKVALYGLIEASQVFQNVFPMREGSVTSIVAGADNWKYFTDSSLDFNINDHLAAGLEAKVTFNTGQLAGYTFTISDYNHATKQFTINKNGDETNLEIPSNTLRPAVGDKYVLIDIVMPQIDLTNAESKLLVDAQKHYDKNSDPKFLMAYSATCDPLFIRQNNITVTLGNTAILFDADMGINTELRISKYTRDLQNANLYPSLEWSDTIGADEIVRQYQQQQKTLKMLASSGLLDPAQMRKALFLNRLSESNGYLMIGGNKVKAGYADDSDLWDGKQFDDYLDQALRSNDDVRFKSISSTNFVSGAFGSGFRIDKDGNAEFDNLTVRKEFNVFELIVNKIRATNGALAVTDAATIAAVVANGANYNITVNEDLPFLVGDLLRCQIFTGTSVKAYWLQVQSENAGTLTVSILSGNAASIASGDTIVRMGNASNANRQGLLYLTSSEAGSPYLDVLDGVTSTNLAGKTKVRLGKLDGIVDAEFGGALSGYGLYAQRAFIKGRIEVTGGNAQTIAGSQALANAAQSAAVLAASNDAQVKANAAQANAAAMVNALQVGGRNFFKKTTGFQPLFGSNPIIILTPSNNGFRLVGRQNDIVAVRATPLIDSGGLWTLSFFGKANSAGSMYIDIADQGRTIINFTTEWKKFVLTVNVDWVNYYPHVFVDFEEILWLDYEIKDFKIEKGNKPTDWTPAPEDVDAAILSAQQAANTANASYAALTTSLKSMAYQDVVELSKLGSTVIENGMIKTTLLDAAYIRANVVNAAYINALNIDASAIKSGIIDSARINASQIVSNGGGATQASVNAAQATAIATAASDATTKLNALSIGGRNYYKLSTPITALFLNPVIERRPAVNGFTITGRQNVNVAIRLLNVVDEGGYYTVSFQAKSNANTTVVMDIADQNHQAVNISTAFTNFAFTFYVDRNINPHTFLDIESMGWLVFDFKNFKIEKGTKATDWTPAPEDLLPAEINGVTIIQGGYINTQLLDAATIRANIINASYINSLQIVTNNLKTATSGKRVEIDSTENNIRILDASGNTLIELDDDSSFEYEKLLGGMIVRQYGQGIRVGAIGARNASLGRFGLTVFDAQGNIKHILGSHGDSTNIIPFQPEVVLDAKYGMVLKNMKYYGNGQSYTVKLFLQDVSTDSGQTYPTIGFELA